jgi:hypothetical protein
LKTAESLLIKEGAVESGQPTAEKSLQIAALSDPIEHLPEKEGLRR